MSYDYKQFYRRKLPHIHSPGSTLFLTFRLAGSIPQNVIRRWMAEKSLLERKPTVSETELEFRRRWFAQFEEVLDRAESGPRWLADPRVAEIVTEGLHYRNHKIYSLHAFCVMSNHVHAVFTPSLRMESLTEVRGPGRLRFESAEPTMDAIMKSLKGYTAYKANRVLNRMGSFWEEESYDHEVKNTEEFYRIGRYVLNNPVKAGLVGHWNDWKWSYCREDLIQSITY